MCIRDSCETQSVILNKAKLPDVFPLEFVFSSGAGAWRTAIVLNQDGSFNGAYLDSDMGDRGNDYPKGDVYKRQHQNQLKYME